MNHIEPEKRNQLLALFRHGVGVRAAAKQVGCHRDTAMRLRRKWAAMPEFTRLSDEDYDLLKDALELALMVWKDASDAHKVERIEAILELLSMSRFLEYPTK